MKNRTLSVSILALALLLPASALSGPTTTISGGPTTGAVGGSGGSGDVATDSIWDALGDVAGGTGSNTAARLAVGANGDVLTADSGEATGLKWAAAPASAHADTITWTGTSLLETGIAFQFGDASDATITHTYANTGTNVVVAYSSSSMDVTTGTLKEGGSAVLTAASTASGLTSFANVTATELAELETLGATSISADDWTAVAALVGVNTGDEAVADLTTSGTIEIATGDETNTGTDATRAVSPDGLDDWTGSAQITTLGTITTGIWQGTAVAADQGGTGATSLTDGAVLLGSGTGAITPLAITGDGEMIVGDGATDPVVESGATLRTSIGVGTGDDVAFADIIVEGTFDFGTVATFSDLDQSPDVGTAAYWNTFTNTLIILDFDGAGIADGQVITVFSKAAITFDIDGGLLRAGSVDIVTASGDVTTWMYDGTDWVLLAFMDDSTDMGTDAGASSGDITAVGDCATGAAFAGACGTVLTIGTSDPADAGALRMEDDANITWEGTAEVSITSNAADSIEIINTQAGVLLTGTTATECVMLMAAGINCDTTNGCATVDEPGDNFDYTVASFATGADDFGTWTFPTPVNISGTTLTAQMYWIGQEAACNDTDTADDVCWNVGAAGIGNDGDFDGASLGTAVQVIDRCIAAGDLNVSAATGAITHGWATDEIAIIEINRDVDAGGTCAADAWPNDADLLAVKICYEVDNVFSGE